METSNNEINFFKREIDRLNREIQHLKEENTSLKEEVMHLSLNTNLEVLNDKMDTVIKNINQINRKL